MLVVGGALSTALGLEERPAGHGGVAHVGAELLDADVTGGEGSRDLCHDARVVGPEQLEVESLRLALGGLVGALEGNVQALGVQRREVRDQRVESLVGDCHQHDAGELARQP